VEGEDKGIKSFWVQCMMRHEALGVGCGDAAMCVRHRTREHGCVAVETLMPLPAVSPFTHPGFVLSHDSSAVACIV
jgi:hypothetical protein